MTSSAERLVAQIDPVIAAAEGMGMRVELFVHGLSIGDQVGNHRATVDFATQRWARPRRPRLGAHKFASDWCHLRDQGRVRTLDVVEVMDAAMTHVWLFDRWREFLRRRPASAVLVDYDRGAHCLPLVLAARSLGLRTFTMVHGAVGRRGYAPLVADQALCWGPRHKRAFQRLGVESERLCLVGRAAEPVRSRIAQPSEVTVRRPRVIYAPNPGAPSEHRAQWAKRFCCAALGAGASAVIRPHPSEDPDLYRRLFARVDHITIEPPERASVSVALERSDVAVVTSSGFADDAVLAGVPAIVVSCPDDPGQDGIREVGYGGLQPPISWRELPAALLAALALSAAERQMLKKFAADDIAPVSGVSAAQNVIDVLVGNWS